MLDRNPGLLVDLLLEVKEAEHLVDAVLELPEPPSPPRPDLRTHVVHDADVSLPELLGQAQVEVGEINEHGQLRPATVHLRQQGLEGPVDARQAAEDLGDADHRDGVGIHRGVDAGAAHGFAAAAENLHLTQARAQGRGQLGAIDLAGPLAGHQHEAGLGHGSVVRRHVVRGPCRGPWPMMPGTFHNGQRTAD